MEKSQNKDHPNQKIKLNDFITLDLLNSSVIVNDKIVYLTKKEMLFLNLLFRNSGSLVTYEMIEELVWYDDNKVMTSTSLRTLVKNIRKKLSFDIVQNISKVGYMLSV